MKKNKIVRREILARVRDYYKSMRQDVFVPGKTRINYAGRVFDEKELVSLVDASLDFWLTAGRFAREFEERFAELIKAKYCVLVNSGSSANLLAVSALTSPFLRNRRLRPGDEVITTACGFPTTLNPILQNNLIPVFVDVGLGDYNIMEQRIEGAITRRTKAIFTTHTLGNPVNIDAVSGIARRHGLWWLEDNCDALGSRYRAKFTGSFGDISTSSFYPAHQITMGEGGAVLTSDPLLKKIIVSLRDWGRDCWCSSGHDNTCRMRFKQRFGRLPYGYDHKYVYSHVGYNFKVTDMQAAIGVAQLKKLPWFIEARKNNFDFLFKVLEGHEDFFILPRKEAQSDPSWFGFPVLVKGSAPFKRADIIHFLEGRNIATRMLFGGNLIKQPAYQGIKYRIAGGLKNTDLVMDNLFWLGVYPGLTGPELAYTKKMLKAFLKDYSVRKGYKR